MLVHARGNDIHYYIALIIEFTMYNVHKPQTEMEMLISKSWAIPEHVTFVQKGRNEGNHLCCIFCPVFDCNVKNEMPRRM